MKNFTIYLVAVLVLSLASVVYAQAPAQKDQAARPLANQGQGVGCPRFVDSNGDGINDNFVDADKDGVCDGWQKRPRSGRGARRVNYGTGYGTGRGYGRRNFRRR